MDRQRFIDDIVSETGRSPREIESTQYDDNGKSKTQRVLGGLRRNLKSSMLVAGPLIAAGTVYLAGLVNEHVLTRTVTPIVWYDKNNDGVQDAVVAFPVKGTGRAIMRWVDGNEIAKNGDAVPAAPQEFQANAMPLDIHFFETSKLPFQMVDDFYNSSYSALFGFVREKGVENERMRKIGEFWSESWIGYEDPIIEGDPQARALFMSNDYGTSHKLADLE